MCAENRANVKAIAGGSKAARLAKLCANGGMFILSCLVPRSKRNVVVGGWYGKRFADNSKAMFLFLNEHRKELNLKHIYFFTRDRQIYSELYSQGFECLLPDGLVSAWWHLRAKYHVVDENGGDIKNLFSARAKRINLWHGFPLKKIGYMCNSELKSYEDAVAYNDYIKKTIRGSWSDQFLLNMSDEQEKQQAFAFGLHKEKLIKGIYPRDAYMLSMIKPFYLACERIPHEDIVKAREDGKKIIFYLPTFRDSKEQNNNCAQLVNELSKLLSSKDYLIVTKLHFAADADKAIENAENVINLPPQSDVYNFLQLSDMLVTDYSSVYIDWLLLNKPLAFCPFDIEEYKSADRGFIYDYEDFTPGDKANNANELCELITGCLENPENDLKKYAEKRQKLIKLFYGDNLPSEKGLTDLWNVIKGLK